MTQNTRVRVPEYLLAMLKDAKPHSNLYYELGKAVAYALVNDLEAVYVAEQAPVVNCPECGSADTKQVPVDEGFTDDELFRFVCLACRLRWKSRFRFSQEGLDYKMRTQSQPHRASEE